MTLGVKRVRCMMRGTSWFFSLRRRQCTLTSTTLYFSMCSTSAQRASVINSGGGSGSGSGSM